MAASIDPWAFGWTAINATAATFAVITALTVAIVQMWDLRGLRRRETVDRRRAQAIRVSAWATSETDFPDTPRANITGNPWYAAVHVLNGSSAAISDIRVQIGHRSMDGQWDSLMETHEWAIVPPGERVRAEFRQGHVRNYAEPRHNVLLCTLSFRDSNNVCWQRNASNTLAEVRGES